MKKEQNKYTLFWLSGTTEIVEGDSISNVMNNRGYGAGAVRALDFYSNGDDRDKWEWDKKKRSWEKNNPLTFAFGKIMGILQNI